MKNIFAPTLCLFLSVFATSCDEDDDVDGRQLSGGVIETLAGGPGRFGYAGDNGPAADAKLGWITSLALDQEGNLYFSDGAANVIRRISGLNSTITTTAGTFIGFNNTVSTPHAGGSGPATSAHLNVPLSVTAAPDGRIIIADAGNHAIREIFEGVISTIAGGLQLIGYDGDGKPAVNARLWNPHGVAVDADGNIFIADKQNNAIRMISGKNNSIITIVGLGPDSAGYSGDNGLATAAQLNSPSAVDVTAKGDIYIADEANNVVRKISGGIITTIAGTSVAGYSGDGTAATSAMLSSPKGIDVDNNGNVYIADSGNNVIRMIEAASGKIFTVAGSGSAGFAGDGGSPTDAQLNIPVAVAVSPLGVLYIADSGNNAIRVVNP